MTITYRPMAEAPDHICGGFNYEMRLFSVSKKGALRQLAHATDCTHEGDRKATQKVDKAIPRIAILTRRMGNQAWETTHYFKR